MMLQQSHSQAMPIDLVTTCIVYVRVVVIDFWGGFIDCNYLSLNRQLIPITITKVANE